MTFTVPEHLRHLPLAQTPIISQVQLRERSLWLLVALLCLVALLGPSVPQPASYHDFADQRSAGPLPHAMDVLSNLGFALAGLTGMWALARAVSRLALDRATVGLAGLFFAGLIVTAGASTVYHLWPDDAGLLLDRGAMVLAFAGLLGLAASQRISRRSGLTLAIMLLLLGPATLAYWMLSGSVFPWAVLQIGGMGLMAWFAAVPPLQNGIAAARRDGQVPWVGVVALYVLAKLLELGDQSIFEWSGHLVSGHSLKHLAASLAAWPVLKAIMLASAAPSVTDHTAQSAQNKPEALHMNPSVNPQAGEHPNQFALLRQRRFAPFFWTQFSGAANDNLFKFAFTVMVTYQLSVSWMQPAMAGLVIGALFILPFLLFSATSGQLTDKYDKTRVIRFVKNFEIVVMGVAAFGFLTANVPVLLLCTFLMGLHSTLFGPVKFAYLPQVLSERELTGGNGMVEMGTFVAILLGNIAGGLLVALPGVGHASVAAGCVLLALLGRLVAQGIPASPATDPGLKINWNPVTETWRNLKLAHGNIVVFRSLLGISWMWFFGAVFLSQFPSLAKDVLHGNEQVASLLLVLFSIGIGTGSLLCEILSKRHVEIGLVPLGAIGMSVFAIDLYFAARGLPPSEAMGVAAFVARPAHWRVMADLVLLSLFAGLYSVPMYALIQLRSQPTHRARIIAANNILNALFMIASSLLAGLCLSAGFTIPQIFLFTGIANAVVAFYIFMLVPEYLLRFVAWVMSRFVYRFRITGDEHIPTTGAAVLACNHVSFVDAVLLMAASPRPIYFVMDHRIFRVPVLGWLFRLAKAIPIAPKSQDPATYEKAFDAAVQVLKEGDLLAIFPEGGITHDGQLQEFKGGIVKILERAAAQGVNPPVIPMALTNLWGSYFSRVEQGGAMVRPFRRGMFNRVGLNVGTPMTAPGLEPSLLRGRVQQLLGQRTGS